MTMNNHTGPRKKKCPSPKWESEFMAVSTGIMFDLNCMGGGEGGLHLVTFLGFYGLFS